MRCECSFSDCAFWFEAEERDEARRGLTLHILTEHAPLVHLRDQFAGQAMAAALGTSAAPMWHEERPGDYAHLAAGAYRLADAMLAARLRTAAGLRGQPG